MKRGKGDEKLMEPMFPRLHVNDTAKGGGPRAPPRNKMALYEQLSIPSERFNPVVLPNNSASVAPPASSIQGNGHERGTFFPLNLHHLKHPGEKSCAGYSISNTQVSQLELKKKLDEEDFMVPIFFHSETGQEDSGNLSPFNPVYLECSTKSQITSDKEPKRTRISGSNLRQESKNQNVEKPKEFIVIGEQSVKSFKSSSARERTQGPLKETDASADQERSRDCLANKFDRLQSIGASLHHESRARSHLHINMCGNDVSNESVRGTENEHFSIPVRDTCREELGSLNNPTFERGYHEDKTLGSFQLGDIDGGDDASETSMVDSVSVLDISPDDVVGIIGQKQFWKARRAIVNQQRVFAVQVFELHRLIKVQRFIAGSPHILFEDSAYLGKLVKPSAAKKLPLDHIIKPSPPIVKRKDDSENPSRKMECSAENVVGKTSVSSVQNICHPSSYRPISGNPPPKAVISDSKMSPWSFHQLPGHQWLVPVMSPSEGLIYKPYPGHGYAGPVCGGCGLPGSNPMMGNFVNPPYGVPASHYHYQGNGVPPPSPPVAHGCFPPYGMPVINPVNSGSVVEHANHFAGIGSHGQAGQLSGGGLISNIQNQSSCVVPTQKRGKISNVVKPRASKESELLGSTASSPSERSQGHATEGRRNPLPLFPTSPVVHVPEHNTDQPTRVIKVVPHHARSATESVARIFQSIQEERNQYDAV